MPGKDPGTWLESIIARKWINKEVTSPSSVKLEPPSIFVQRRWWHPTPVLLPGKSHGWRSLVGFSPWGREESDMTEWLPFHFSLSCIGAGNGNPLQCSCLENPMDGGAWWAAVHGVAQSWTRLKRLSSSIFVLQVAYFRPSMSAGPWYRCHTSCFPYLLSPLLAT